MLMTDIQGGKMFRLTVKDIQSKFVWNYRNEMFVTDKTGVKMLEIPAASFLCTEPAIFGAPNEDYIEREIEWYMSQSRNVNDIPGGAPEIWKQVADKDGYINSNYGWCIFSPENGNQYSHVLDELSQNPNSRRAVMIYTRPTMHQDYSTNGMSDFMCTNAVQYMIRDGYLEVIVQMRSNDVIFGYRNDFAWQNYVASKLQSDLNLPGRNIFWQVGSLHIYERHFNYVEEKISELGIRNSSMVEGS